MNIYVNGRFRAHRVTGVQRVAHEITRRLADNVEIREPKRKLAGWQGHLWEQTVLPLQCRNGLLWNPCASGPIGHLNHVVTFHDMFVLDSPEWYKPAYVSWYGYTLRQLAQTAQHIIAVSDYTKSRIVARCGVDASKVTVVYNGVDPAWFSTSPSAAPAARHALQLPTNRYLLCVGSLEPRKNLKTLLAAWREVVNDLPAGLWLVITGTFDANVYRSAGVTELAPRVHFTGYVPEAHLPGLYAGSLGFVYPSLAEGFGLPPLEAMACGVPVLTSHTTALPEVCSTSALYFDPAKQHEIARCIKLLVDDRNLQQNLSGQGRQQASRFNWERSAEQTLAVLRAIASPAHCVFC